MTWQRLILGFLVLLTSSCSKALLQSDVMGLWLDQSKDRLLELTPHKIAVEVFKNPYQVLAYKFELEDGELELNNISKRYFAKKGLVSSRPSLENPVPVNAWNLEVKNHEDLLVHRDSRIWNLKKSSSHREGLDNLTGLWGQFRDDGRKDYFEFTPWSTLVVLRCLTEAELEQTACEWWRYEELGEHKLRLKGVTQDEGEQEKTVVYSLDGNVLTMKLNGKTYTLTRSEEL